jgi:hypothetical protein
LQLRNLQSLVEIGVDHNTTVVFPAPLMSTIQELGTFLAHEAAAGTTPPQPSTPTPTPTPTTVPPAAAGIDQATNGAPTTGRD